MGKKKGRKRNAVAEAGGKIVAVGSKASVMKLKGPQTQMIDLKGRALLPGFVDAHGHMMGGGIQALSANLLAARSGLVDLGCFDFGSLGCQGHDRVNGPVEFVDAIEMHRQKFAGRDVLVVQRSNQRGER